MELRFKRKEVETEALSMSKYNKKKINIFKIIATILILLVGTLSFSAKISGHIGFLLQAIILIVFLPLVKTREQTLSD